MDDEMDEETLRLEREFEARMGQMKELGNSNKNGSFNEEKNTGQQAQAGGDNGEGEKPKELSSTELLMQRLAAMGALDENSAPISSSNVQSTGSTQKRTPRRSPGRSAREEIPAKKEGPPVAFPAAPAKEEAPSPLKPSPAKAPIDSDGPKKSKAEMMAEKKAKFEAKMKRRAEERKKAAEKRKQAAAAGGSVSSPRKPKPKPKPKLKAAEPLQEEEHVDTGPSSTDLLMQRLAAMGVMDGGAEDAVPSTGPPKQSRSVSKTPEKKKASPKKKSPKAVVKPASPEPPKKVENSKTSAQPQIDAQANEPGDTGEDAGVEQLSSTELLRRRLESMGMPGADAAPVPPGIRSKKNKSPKTETAELKKATPEKSNGTEALRARMANLRSARSPTSDQSSSAPAGARATSPQDLRDRLATMKSAGAPKEDLKSVEENSVSALTGPSEMEGRNSADYSETSVQSRSQSRSTTADFKDARNLTVEEVREQYEAEHEILNQEVLETREDLIKETSRRKELEELLAKTMHEFEETISDSNLRRADDVARIGLQDTELTQLREKVENHEFEVRQLKKVNQELEANSQLLTESEQGLSKQLDATKKELARSQELFEQLKKHAESKLQNAAKLYAEMQKLAEQKISESRQLTSERDQMRQKISHLEKQLHTAQQNILMMEERSAGLTKQVQELSQSSSSYKSQWFEANNGFQQAKQQNMELIAINDRYRITITQLQEEKRRLEGDAKGFKSVQEDMKQLQDSNNELQEANRALKSRIFDAMESEKQFKQRIETLKSGGASSGADDQIADLQAEVRKLKVQLRQAQAEKEAKDKENKELVNICDDLLNKLETQKEC